MATQFFVYVLHCADGSYYIGYTTDLQKRLHVHNISKYGAKYTKSRRPVRLIYSEEFNSKSEALKREIFLKSLSRTEKEKILQTKKIIS